MNEGVTPSRPSPDKYGGITMMETTAGVPEVAVEDWEIYGSQICEEMENDPTGGREDVVQ